jgi:hypothetical protein
MSRDALQDLEILVQHNVALREALVAERGTPKAVKLLTEAAAANRLNVTPGQIDDFLSKAIAGNRHMLPAELDGIAAGYDPQKDPSRTDPYWSDADLPLGATKGTGGFPGKSGA